MSAPEPPAGWAWLESSVVSGEAAEPGSATRQRIFDEVSADRAGPTARRLLILVTDERPAVRRTTFTLLAELCGRDQTWPAAAEAAQGALGDPDEQARRAATWLLAVAGESDLSVTVLQDSTDPVVRVALVEAMTAAPPSRRNRARWSPTVLGLRSDRTPAVRLLATIEALRSAEEAEWPALDAAIRADLDAADGMLGAAGSHLVWSAGQRWASAFHHRGREHDLCSWAERLLDPAETPAARRTGMDLAVEAMRTWRAAPARLVPALSRALDTPLRAAAARALSASLTATRLAADRLVTVADDPEVGATAAVALGGIGDQRAGPYLARMMRAGNREPGLGMAVATLAPGSAVLVAAARSILADHPDECPLPWWECKVEPATLVLKAARQGAAEAVPELMARVQAAMDRGDHAGATREISILLAIGPAARAAMPLLQRYAASSEGSANLSVQQLLMITSDRAVADSYLAERPEQPGHCRAALALFTWLLDHGGLTDRQHRQLRHLFSQPGSMQIGTAEALWRCEGPAAAADLLKELPKYLTDDGDGIQALRVFAAMGTHARPVLGLLDELTRSRYRAGFHGGPDAEMRADEALLAAALTTREHITR